MTFEYAVYFKLLLICGYNDELKTYIDNALIEQNPLSDIVIELSTSSSDDKKMLSTLNEYLLQVKDTDIDYDKTVFELVLSFLKIKYIEESMSMADITSLMYKLAVCTDRYLDEPWNTMYFLGSLFDEAESGYIDKKDYQCKFTAFLNEGICFCDYPPVQVKESILKKILRKIRDKK
ncbi:MAG: hypothetical protein E7535_11455 [Ruminococcaceae bacterium]|nr:hypothetical protein [Oscillospiraceae bacterium]